MPRKLTAMTCAVVLLLLLPTACNPLDRLFQKQDTDPESCDVTWLLRNASGRELWFEFADFGLHSLQAGQSAEIMRTTVRGSDIQTSFYEVFDYRPQSHPLSIYTDGGSVPARIWTLEERDKPGKQFYDRGAWTFDRTDEERAEWTFTVTADDLE